MALSLMVNDNSLLPMKYLVISSSGIYCVTKLNREILYLIRIYRWMLGIFLKYLLGDLHNKIYNFYKT